MRCKFCDEDKPLIRAHIIPAAFFVKNGARILSSSPEVYPKKSPIAVYADRSASSAGVLALPTRNHRINLGLHPSPGFPSTNADKQ
jgi:hypothetical protein